MERLVRDGDSLFLSSGAAEPRALIAELLADIAPRRSDLRFLQVLTGSQARIFEAAKYGHRLLTPAPGRLRAEAARGEVDLLELSMGQCSAAIEAGSITFDGALLTGVRSGEEICLVPATDLSTIVLERARFCAVELLPEWAGKPRGPRIAVADVDYLVEGERPATLAEPRTPREIARQIGGHVAGLIPAGAAVELGVGMALEAVADCLIEVGTPISVHTGLISDWTQKLVEAGVASVELECAGGRPVLAAIAMGSERFNSWLETTDAVAFADSRHAHDPAHLCRCKPFVAINSAMAVDLDGRVGLFPGTPDAYPPGGLLDFAIAGSYGGLSIVALTSQTLEGRTRVVSELGSVHLPSGLATHVVTEFGVAAIQGLTRSERRDALLAISHPDHRPSLADRDPTNHREQICH
ncbi:MAG: acetyl-CoA hydrolase/transferase C-terminal domain-containing protein [Solirubrobacterales bacterium]